MAAGNSSALIIEDEQLIALDLEAILEDIGFNICGVAATEDEAVALAIEHEPDLITVDVSLREGSGVRAAARIQDHYKPCFIYVTADRSKVEAEASGAICVDKPFNASKIAKAIEQALPGEISR